jgi:hypothetical protein
MKSLLFAALISTFSLHAWAGPSVTGGGKGVVCRDANGAVRTVELLDLWEARTLYHRNIIYSNESAETPVAKAAERFIGERWSAGYPEVTKILKKMNVQDIVEGANLFLGKPSMYSYKVERLTGVTLMLSEDSFEDAWPSDCAVEQIVSFRPGVALYLNQDLFDKMNATNQAALMVHEALYSLKRFHAMTIKSSVRARRAVGFVFSGGAFDQFPDEKIPRYSCLSMSAQGKFIHDTVSLFVDPKSGDLMSSVSGGYEDQPYGYFPKKVRNLSGPANDFKTILSASAHCKTYKDGEYFMIAGLGGAGPSDFDRDSALVGQCKRGRLQPFFSSEWFTGKNTDKLVRLQCKLSK